MKSDGRASSAAFTRLLLAGGVAWAGVSTWLILDARPRPAAVGVALAGISLLLAGYRATLAGDRLDKLLDPVLDRVFDAAILGSIAWTARLGSPRLSAAALAAMTASFLSSYVRAKGASLDYDLRERAATRGVRYALVALGLAAGWLAWTIWAVAALSVSATLIRTSQVVKEERA